MLNNNILRWGAQHGAFKASRSSFKPLLILTALAIVFLLIVARMAFSAQMKPTLTAGWYGDDQYRDKLTASGESFREGSFCAASWDYPFGTYLKVTNKDTGYYVIVRVNDRGPSKKLVAKGRILDLSKAAFAQLADVNKGIIPVTIEKI